MGTRIRDDVLSTHRREASRYETLHGRSRLRAALTGLAWDVMETELEAETYQPSEPDSKVRKALYSSASGRKERISRGLVTAVVVYLFYRFPCTGIGAVFLLVVGLIRLARDVMLVTLGMLTSSPPGATNLPCLPGFGPLHRARDEGLRLKTTFIYLPVFLLSRSGECLMREILSSGGRTRLPQLHLLRACANVGQLPSLQLPGAVFPHNATANDPQSSDEMPRKTVDELDSDPIGFFEGEDVPSPPIVQSRRSASSGDISLHSTPGALRSINALESLSRNRSKSPIGRGSVMPSPSMSEGSASYMDRATEADFSLPIEFEVKEQDGWLPIANVARIMKNALPQNAKFTKEAKECMQECVSEFISFITSEGMSVRSPFDRPPSSEH